MRSSSPRRIAPGDELVGDLGLDSLDFIDIVSVFESRFSTEVVDRVIDRLPELTTAGDLIAAFLAADAAT